MTYSPMANSWEDDGRPRVAEHPAATGERLRTQDDDAEHARALVGPASVRALGSSARFILGGRRDVVPAVVAVVHRKPHVDGLLRRDARRSLLRPCPHFSSECACRSAPPRLEAEESAGLLSSTGLELAGLAAAPYGGEHGLRSGGEEATSLAAAGGQGEDEDEDDRGSSFFFAAPLVRASRGGAMGGGAESSREEPRGAGRSREELGGAGRSREEPRGAERSRGAMSSTVSLEAEDSPLHLQLALAGARLRLHS